jgi:hypothetical protein
MGFADILGMLRDIVIILLGVVWLIAGVIVALIAWFTFKFVRSLPNRTEGVTAQARDLLGQVRQTVGTAGEGARTATDAVTFISDRAVNPTIQFVAAVAGVRRFIEILASGKSSRNGSNVA